MDPYKDKIATPEFEDMYARKIKFSSPLNLYSSPSLDIQLGTSFSLNCEVSFSSNTLKIQSKTFFDGSCRRN